MKKHIKKTRIITEDDSNDLIIENPDGVNITKGPH